MTAHPRQWPIADVDLVALLRRQLDESRVRIGELEIERDALKATLLGEAVVADSEGEDPNVRGATWWWECWRYVSEHRSVLLRRVQQLEQWCQEHGKELTKLQTDLGKARDDVGVLTRQLDLARSGERCDSREVD